MNKPSPIDLDKLDKLDSSVHIDQDSIDNKSRRSVLTKYSEVEEDQPKAKRTKKVKPVSFSISFELDQKIDKFCESKYMKKSTFAVLAFEEYLHKRLKEDDI
ncbi:hypothetical protein ACFQ88_39385 [Paenibacillus sp. NPDC056579]|uniref:hypothetical protein n=1 Tax=Paenibacillus sp. NPDC056579 TaxID=3345871 RepID=UPI0036898AFE